jgi:hypothetical protein
MNDEKLIIASKSGDSQAFKKLVKRYQNRVSTTEIDGLYKHCCKPSGNYFPTKIAVEFALNALHNKNIN